MVRQRSAKPSFAGSIPAVASIKLPPDFSFEATVESHGWDLLAPFRWSRKESVLRRPEAVGGLVYDLEIRAREGLMEPRLQPGIHRPAKRDGAPMQPRLARMFQLDLDLSEFHGMHSWASDKKFGRLLCGSTLFEDAVKIIATTNTTWRQTVRMVELLVEKCGRRSPLGFAAFPDPEDILRYREDELQADCRLGYRAKSIHALAKGIVDGTIELAKISDPSQTTEGLFASYKTLPGIGPYGAAHLLAMDGRHDFIAVDSEFRRFVREKYHHGRSVADATLLRRYAKWGRWKYLAYWSELWESVADRLQPADAEDK